MDDAMLWEIEASAQPPPGTTAAAEWAADPREGPNPWPSWFTDQLEAGLRRFVLHLHEPFGVALVESDGVCRVFHQSPCEQDEWFADRLAREARAMADPWLFATLPDRRTVAPIVLDVDGPRRTRPDGLVVHWYAEARGAGVASVRHGAYVLDGTEIVIGEEPTPTTDHPWFGAVLRGHPARRRFRLRGR